MTIFISVLIAVIGLLIYKFVRDPKISEAGRIAYFAGLLGIVLQTIGEAVSLHKQ